LTSCMPPWNSMAAYLARSSDVAKIGPAHTHKYNKYIIITDSPISTHQCLMWSFPSY
jgi:hypothetical protein